MQGMLDHSERNRRHKRQQTHQIILRKNLFYNVEGVQMYQR